MKYIIANLKSNKNRTEMKAWLDEFKSQSNKPLGNTKVIICPPAPFLIMVSEFLASLQDENVSLGVQDISPFTAGAYTGAVSARNLEGLGVNYALVGHSERRQYFHETNQEVANKVAQCVENNIIPIVCVDADYISAQANAINRYYLAKCLVAYEPLSAIGSGENQPVDEVLPVIEKIHVAFDLTPVIYGGSVNAGNVKDYVQISDGVLVGGTSLDAQKFGELITF